MKSKNTTVLKALHLPTHVVITAKLYLLLLAIYTVFRLLLFFTCLPKMGDATLGDILTAFGIGVRFDCVVIGFAIALPVVLITIMSFIGKTYKALTIATTTILTIILVPTFAVCAADVPYFNQFFIHFNSAAFDGLEGNESVVAKMIFQEARFSLMIVLTIVVSIAFGIVAHRIMSKTPLTPKHYISKSIYTVLLLMLMFAGMRSNLNFKTRPIHTGIAYFGNNQFLNQLGLNPVFVFLNSFTHTDEEKLELMDAPTALSKIQERYGINNPNPHYPLARTVSYQQPPRHLNVVLILMESMSANNMARHGNTKKLTPFLDSLADKSLYFDNCYTMGNRTCSGMYSTITAYPSLFDKQPMYGTPIRQYNTLPLELKKHGYNTTFFLSHDKNFDNSNGFLLANGYDKIFSQEDYPAQEIKNTWGVCDEYLLNFALQEINTMAQKGNPFLATILTISNHPPYYFDPSFAFRNSKDEEKIVEYADAMLQNFFAKAQKESWFDSTIFVLIADHGNAQDITYPLPLSYFHAPLMFYAPAIIAPQTNNNMANQIDAFPTIMGMLRLPHTANYLGMDLGSTTREYACIMNVSGYAIMDNEWMLYCKKNTLEKRLYKYRSLSTTNYINEEKERAERMDKYGKEMWQTTQYILDKHATLVKDTTAAKP